MFNPSWALMLKKACILYGFWKCVTLGGGRIFYAAAAGLIARSGSQAAEFCSFGRVAKMRLVLQIRFAHVLGESGRISRPIRHPAIP